MTDFDLIHIQAEVKKKKKKEKKSEATIPYSSAFFIV